MQRTKSLTMVLAVAVVIAGAAVAGSNVIDGKCVKVIDGDTILVECEKGRQTVEIDGIDAPELGQPWGKDVRSFVKNMVGGESIELEVVSSDADVIRARVMIDGADLSEILVSRGLAWVPDDAGDPELAELGERARKLPCGLWTDTDAQAPWEFRETAS